MNNPSVTDLHAAKKLIDSVDLNPTIERLVKVHNWPRKEAIEASKQYRNYLFLKKKYGDSHPLPPSHDIDEAWHAHILHTEDYYNFCKQVFGEFLHHHPHHGKDNSITDDDIAKMFEKTQEFYYTEFGEYIRAIRPIPIKMRVQRFLKELKANNP
jgi:hypothetical protein